MTPITMAVVDEKSTGLQLFRIDSKEQLLVYEQVQLLKGKPAVVTALARAEIMGLVDIGGDIDHYFLDLIDSEGDMLQTVALDKRSFEYLKRELRPKRA